MTGSASPDRFSSPVPLVRCPASLLQKTPPFWGEALPSDQSFGLSFFDKVSAKASESHFWVGKLGDSSVLRILGEFLFFWGRFSGSSALLQGGLSGPTCELPNN